MFTVCTKSCSQLPDIHKEKKGTMVTSHLTEIRGKRADGTIKQGAQSGVGAILITGMLDQAAPKGAAEFSRLT